MTEEKKEEENPDIFLDKEDLEREKKKMKVLIFPIVI